MIYLNLGSNLSSIYGDRKDNINKALNLLEKNEIKILKKSNYYETPSYPEIKYPKFVNLSCSIRFKYPASTLLEIIKIIEKKMGRIRTEKNKPRICDIDIIDFNGLIINRNNLKIPHEKCHLRNFVLYPILQIDSDWVHPIIKKNVKFLINNLDQKSRIEITRLNKNVIINKT